MRPLVPLVGSRKSYSELLRMQGHMWGYSVHYLNHPIPSEAPEMLQQ
jgi:hypothetical protein